MHDKDIFKWYDSVTLNIEAKSSDLKTANLRATKAAVVDIKTFESGYDFCAVNHFIC